MRHCLDRKEKNRDGSFALKAWGSARIQLHNFFSELNIFWQAGVVWVFRWYVRACVRAKLLIDPHFSACVRTPTKTPKKKQTRTQKQNPQIQQNVPSATALHESMTVHLLRVLWVIILLHAQSAQIVPIKIMHALSVCVCVHRSLSLPLSLYLKHARTHAHTRTE